jgi:hypothetical protein
VVAYKSSRASEKDFHGQSSVYDGLLTFPQRGPIPPVLLLDGQVRIAGLRDCAAEDIEAADVMLLAGPLTKPVIKLIAVLQR